ncbi:MAG: lipase family protein [Acidimicrobiales bacterium]
MTRRTIEGRAHPRPRSAAVGLLLGTVVMVAATTAPPATASAAPAPGTAASVTTTTATPSTAPLLPGQDPFYRYTGTTPLADIAPGTVLDSRPIDLAAGTVSTPVQAEQLLYRTTGELGQPTVTVTTVIAPLGQASPPRLVGYLSFYDALGAQCDPSYTLQGGDPGSANEQQTDEEELIIGSYVAAGFVLTIPDFEGEDLEWTAGQEAGYGTLDALRATESYLGMAADSPVGLTGYSGGSIAADWASELAPSYAPALDLVGVAEGGIPVDYAHNLAYINGSAGWSGVLPATLVALGRAFGEDITPYLSPYGKKLAAQVRSACIGSFEGAYPGLTVQKLVKKKYRDVFSIPALVQINNELIMGSTPGNPTGPLFMAVGDADGTGDGIMVVADVEALATEYCDQGVGVQLAVYQGDDHEEAAVQFEPAAVTFLEERFAGVPFSSGCASIPAGDSIAPLPTPSS